MVIGGFVAGLLFEFGLSMTFVPTIIGPILAGLVFIASIRSRDGDVQLMVPGLAMFLLGTVVAFFLIRS